MKRMNTLLLLTSSNSKKSWGFFTSKQFQKIGGIAGDGKKSGD
jgi:hypothetical protein